jgi:hypothetical protein
MHHRHKFLYLIVKLFCCNTIVNVIIGFSKGLHVLFSVVISQWRLQAGVIRTANIHQQLRDVSDSFSEFSQVQTTIYSIVLTLMPKYVGLF